MAVKVKKFRVRAGDEVYFPGDVITDLGAEEEARLVKEGYCDPVVNAHKETSKRKVKDEKPEDNSSDDGPNTGLSL